FYNRRARSITPSQPACQTDRTGRPEHLGYTAAMKRALTCVLVIVGAALSAQDVRRVPRPSAQSQATNPGSTTPDGYAPIPQWAGQTRAPLPDTRAADRTEVVAKGLRGGFGFHFLPDGRIVVSERPGRIRIVATDGRVSEPLAGLPPIYARGPQGLFEVL